MMPRRKINRRTTESTVIPIGKSRHKYVKYEYATQADVREYIGAMAAQLAEMAFRSRLDSLAVACDVVREIAEGNVNSQTRQVESSATRPS